MWMRCKVHIAASVLRTLDSSEKGWVTLTYCFIFSNKELIWARLGSFSLATPSREPEQFSIGVNSINLYTIEQIL